MIIKFNDLLRCLGHTPEVVSRTQADYGYFACADIIAC